MEHIKLFKHGFITLVTATLIACGGGGGGTPSGINYTGSTSQARITADNVEDLFGAGTGAESPPNTAASVSGSSSQQSKQKNSLSRFARRLSHASTSISSEYNGTSSVNAVIVSADEVIPGDCGGEAVVTGTKDDDPAIFNVDLTVTFNNYCEGGGTFNGVMGLSGKDNNDTGEFSIRMTFTNITFDSDEDSMALNGEVSAAGTITDALSDFSVNMTLNFKDNRTNKVFRVEDYVLTFYDEGGLTYTVTLNAKVYHHDFGFFIFTTTTPVQFDSTTDLPVSGEIVLTGDNSSATVTFYDGYYIITVDDGGNISQKNCDSSTDICTDI